MQLLLFRALTSKIILVLSIFVVFHFIIIISIYQANNDYLKLFLMLKKRREIWNVQ